MATDTIRSVDKDSSVSNTFTVFAVHTWETGKLLEGETFFEKFGN